MAERKSMNKYYPPDWDPSKGSINQYRGQHHLRDRAKKIDQGILVIRFEMPFSVWCLACENHIGMGVRFNAEKKAIDKYFTTNIYSFKMKCHICSNQFEIQTDPKNTEYKIINGLRKRTEEFDPIDAELPSSSFIKYDNDEKNNNNNNNDDTLLKLENKKIDIDKGKKESTRLEQLQEIMTNRTVNDYQLSSKMRKSFREKKKEEQIELERQQSKGIMIPLLKEHQDDIDAAKDIDFNFNSLKRKLDESKKIKRELIKNESVLKLSNNNNNNNNSISNNNKIENIIRKKSRIDPSLFNNNNNNDNKSKVNETFTLNLFK
ncbi:hypothetical protein RB653_005999 [Dictyostelium firmibasis]|uniref:Coiled-coil domain-containing protein 130 homolog n=1 Tax=Dictyostelium firmibasis TaxID=79012 RepID=A0AAN7ULZ6_9MYCE